MSIEFDRGFPGKFDSRTLSRETLSRWAGRMFRGGARKSTFWRPYGALKFLI